MDRYGFSSTNRVSGVGTVRAPSTLAGSIPGEAAKAVMVVSLTALPTTLYGDFHPVSNQAYIRLESWILGH